MKIYQHPLGFLRVEFFRDSRGADMLHVWDTPGYTDSDIHQHSSDFSSTIIAGVLTEDLFAYAEDPGGEYERLQAVCYADPDGDYHVDIAPERVRVKPVLLATVAHHPGETYVRPKADFHRVTATQVPLVTRRSVAPVTEWEHFILRPLRKG